MERAHTPNVMKGGQRCGGQGESNVRGERREGCNEYITLLIMSQYEFQLGKKEM